MSRSSQLFITLMLAGVGTISAQTVKVNWQTKNDFAKYHTYSWVVNTQQRNNDLYRPWIEKDVNAELAKKGWTPAKTRASADVYIDYHRLDEQADDVVTTTDDTGIGWGWGGGWGGYGGFGGWGDMGGMGESSSEVEPRMMGIVTIDIKDPKIKEVVWRGQATVDSVSNTQKGDEKQIEKCVQKMFKQFPPKSKG